MKRYSKKRQSIIDCLKSTDTHPTAEWVYSQLKPQYPDLSLATVYRNLKELVLSGEAIVVDVVDGKVRFDGKTRSHTHAVCTECGKVIDLEDITVSEEMLEKAKAVSGFFVTSSKLQFSGLCAECMSREQNR